MGVKANLTTYIAALSSTDTTAAEKMGTDITGDLYLCVRKVEEIINTLNYLTTDVVTSAVDSTMYTNLTGVVTALT